MSRAVVRGGFDTWVGAANPTAEHPGAKHLRLDAGGQESYLYFRSPVPRGATVTSATLRVYARGASSGARTLTARRVAESWKARQTNWNNRPGTTGTAASKAFGALADGDPIEIDVTAHLQTIANGAGNFGWKITTDATTGHRIYGLDAGVHKPTLVVVWSDAPAAPTSLAPDEGATSKTHPTLTFDYTDVSGNTELAAVRVQISATKNGTTPDFDVTVPTEEPELDLAQTAFPGLTGTTYWRVYVQDGGGLWSEPSAWATLAYLAKPTTTITNPANIADPFVTESTPPITWTSSGSQVAWQVRITAQDDRSKILYDSGKRKGNATAHTLPKGILRDDRRYAVNVRTWDGADREATPGDPIFSFAWRDFFMDDDLTVPSTASLTATAVGDAPWVDLTWTRSTMPDAWEVVRDGKVILREDDPADLLETGTTYSWRDHTASPQRQHVYTVRAVVNGKRSTPGPSASITTSPVGIWLIDLDRGVTVSLAGDDEGTWSMTDDASTYVPIGSEETVRIVSGMRGLEGNLQGLLVDGFHGKTFEAQEGDLLDVKERPSQTVRLVAADVNMRVLIGNVSIAPTPITRKGEIVKRVSFDFWQTGDLGFTPRI